MIVEVWQGDGHFRHVCAVPQEDAPDEDFIQYGQSLANLKNKHLIRVFHGHNWDDCMDKYHFWIEYHHQEWEEPRYRR